MAMAKRFYFNDPVRYNETNDFKEEMVSWAFKQGKDLSEWIRNATREQIKRERVERGKDYQRGAR